MYFSEQFGDRARKAEDRLSSALDVIREVEKVNDDYPYCPTCGAFSHKHKKDCKLVKTLAGDSPKTNEKGF